jgi:hypothetical protein
MSDFSRLPESNKGSALEKLALFCALLAVACVLGAHGMDKLAQNGGLPSISFNRGEQRPNIDYSATATIPHRAQSTNLNPCGQN